MSSFSKILLVYDGSEEAEVALRRCSQLSIALNAQVDVVSVMDADGMNATSGGLLTDLAYGLLEETARNTLRSAIEKLAVTGVSARGYILFGRTVDAVFRHATAFSSDVVVVGHRTPRGFWRWWRGERPVHVDLAERLRGPTIVTVTL
ncbi:universal stress protein [Paraburkholderia flagellata]|uniref:universal stress protein n=1 Tax=Paraburkholderia flagellata TaxID=2883241 RepID=UPI00227944B5|nr:universal stress protein [Paraburkholderia flagellata]